MDLYAKENEELRKRLVTLSSREHNGNGRDESETGVSVDPQTGKFYATEWHSYLGYRAGDSSHGYDAEEISATPELRALAVSKGVTGAPYGR